MSKRPRKGYYVKGEFIAGTPEPDPTSRTAKKKASERVQELGEALVAARASLVDGLPLPESLKDAIGDAREISSLGAKRRQLQFIGKLMRRLDDEELAAVCAALGTEP